MNALRRVPSWLALAGVYLAGAAGVAHAQLGQGDLQERALPFGAGVFVQPDEAASLAIGDPWWDDAVPQPPAGDAPAAPAQEPGDDEADDADPQVQLQAQLQAQAEMLRQVVELQGLAILRRELSVVRQTCPSLEKQQRALVLQAGRQAIEKVVDDQMTAALGRRRGRQADIETAVSEALRTSVAANAAAEESAAYEAERGLRKGRAKQATVAALVADVDRDAFLDDAERETLARTLAESYRERWRPAVTSLQQGMAEFPAPPPPGVERCVEKALGKERKAEWLARREDAAKQLAQAGGMEMQMLGNGGMVQIQAQAIGGAGGAVRRVIRRRVVANGNGVEMQVEVQVGVGGGEGEGAAAAEEEKE
jgi:hypothetical protein